MRRPGGSSPGKSAGGVLGDGRVSAPQSAAQVQSGRRQNMNFVTLNNGIKMPMTGFGVYQMSDHGQ